MPTARILLALCGVISALTNSAAAATIGSEAYRVSTAMPWNWRGDFTGRFPDATPPVRWSGPDGQHIRWRVPMPAHGCEAPLVVGDRVYVLSNPCILTCLDAASGETLWEQREFDLVWPQTAKLPPAEKEALHAAILTNIAAQVHQGFRSAKGLVATMQAAPDNERFATWLAAVQAGNHADVVGRISKGDELPHGMGTAKTNAWHHASGAVLAKHGIDFDVNADRGYMRWTGMVFVPPISDGERIYVRWPGNRWAAYSPNGERLWVNTDASHRRDRHPELKWKDPHHGILWDGHLLVPGGARGGFTVIDPASGKTVKKVEAKMKNYGRNYTFIPLLIDGEARLITRNGMRIEKDFSVSGAAGDLFTGNAGPNRYKRPFGDYGALQYGDLLYAGFGSYDAKDGCGLKVYELTAGPTLTLKQKVPLNKAALSDRARQRNKHGQWKADVNWRGMVLGDQHVYFFGAAHWVTILDRQSFEIVDFYQMYEGPADGTSQPIYADGKVYCGTWSGRTGVIDDATGELVAVNQTEPIVSAGLVPRGKRLFIRGLLSTYCIEAE